LLRSLCGSKESRTIGIHPRLGTDQAQIHDCPLQQQRHRCFGFAAELAFWFTKPAQNILDSPPVVTILHSLEQRDSPVSRQILQAIDQIADKYNLHDDVLDGILVDLGLE
jgi:hypothetical protein